MRSTSRWMPSPDGLAPSSVSTIDPQISDQRCTRYHFKLINSSSPPSLMGWDEDGGSLTHQCVKLEGFTRRPASTLKGCQLRNGRTVYSAHGSRGFGHARCGELGLRQVPRGSHRYFYGLCKKKFSLCFSLALESIRIGSY